MQRFTFFPGSEDILRTFISDLQNVFKNSLRSVIIYGASVNGRHEKGKTEIRSLILLEEERTSTLRECLKKMEDWKKHDLAIPLIFTISDLIGSAETLPLEIFDIKSNYRCIYGPDPFEDLKLGMNNLRLECEHEIQTKTIQLKKAFLSLDKQNSDIRILIRDALQTFLIVFRNILRLKGLTVPAGDKAIVHAVVKNYSLHKEIFDSMLEVFFKTSRKTDEELMELYENFIAEMRQLQSEVKNILF